MEIFKLTYSLDCRKNSLPDTLSRNTSPELLTRKMTVETPPKKKFFLAKDETSPRLEYKCPVKTDLKKVHLNNLQLTT